MTAVRSTGGGGIIVEPKAGGGAEAGADASGGGSGRGYSQAAATAFADAAVREAAEAGAWKPEPERGDQRILENDDGVLDPDRPFDPEDYDPHRGRPAGQGANRGNIILELFVGHDGTVRSASIGVTDPARQASVLGEERVGQRHRLVSALGRVLAERNEDAIRAASANEGMRLIIPMTGAEAKEKSRGGIQDRSWLSRMGEDRVRFPWGVVDLKSLVTAAKGGDKGASLDDEMFVVAWEGWLESVHRAETEAAQRAAIRTSVVGAGFSCPDALPKRLHYDFRLVHRHDAVLRGLAATAVDLNDFRAVAEPILRGDPDWWAPNNPSSAAEKGARADGADVTPKKCLHYISWFSTFYRGRLRSQAEIVENGTERHG